MSDVPLFNLQKPLDHPPPVLGKFICRIKRLTYNKTGNEFPDYFNKK
jgi:hypothetical protein